MKQLLSGNDWIVSPFLPCEVHPAGGHIKEITNNILFGGEFIPAAVPGDVQSDALDAGWIEDINYGFNARKAEWTYQRDWLYVKRFKPEEGSYSQVRLCFDGVDFKCEVFLNGKWLGNHENAWMPFDFDVTDKLNYGEENCLIVIVKSAPDAECQFGRTNRVRHLKARFAYGWDWCTRLVPLGIWQDVYLKYDHKAYFKDFHVTTDVDYKNKKAIIYANADFCGDAKDVNVTFTLKYPCGKIETKTVAATKDNAKIEFEIENAELWYPNNMGEQPLYNISAVLGDDWEERSSNVGLRRIEWARTEGAPDDALPYQPYVNGRRMYIQGYNFVPVRQLYGRPHNEVYERRIALAKAAGTNFLRIWGGGLLEREIFYDLCDKNGILVMQELFQSSASINNHPPRDPEYIAMMEEVTRSAVIQKRNHTCLAIWCGGNELCFRGDYMDAKGNIYIENAEGMEGYNYDVYNKEFIPLAAEYPTLAAMGKVVKELDGERLWLHSCTSGPKHAGALVYVGGLMHDVHGPWHMMPPEEIYHHYNAMDMMLHSEFGCQGGASMQVFEKDIPEKYYWPLDEFNVMVNYHGRMWRNAFTRSKTFFGEELNSHERYSLATRFIQWDQYGYACDAHRRLDKKCAGSILWHFAEPWPNIVDTSVVDAYDMPKPAFYGQKSSFKPIHIAAFYENIIHKDIFEAEIGVFNSTENDISGKILAEIYTLDGKLNSKYEFSCDIEKDSVVHTAGKIKSDKFPDGVFFLRLTLFDSVGNVLDRVYSIHSTEDIPYAQLLTQKECEIEAKKEGNSIVLKNTGECVVSGLTVEAENNSNVILSDGCLMLLPGEEAKLLISGDEDYKGKFFIHGFGVSYRQIHLL